MDEPHSEVRAAPARPSGGGAAASAVAGPADQLRALLNRNGDFRSPNSLWRQAAPLMDQIASSAGQPPVRVALVGGATLDLLVRPLKLALAAQGLHVELWVGGHNQFMVEMLAAGGPLDAFAPRIVIVFNTPFNVPAWPELNAGGDDVRKLAERVCEELLAPCRAVHERTGCEVVLNTLHPLPGRPAGNLGAKLPGDRTNFVRRLNVALGDRAPDYVHLNDVAALVERRGLDAWLDLRLWYHAKQPVGLACVAEYAANTAAIVGALLGRTRKCAVLDLDNTLWGGVVGDDGVDGIALGEGDALGEAFKAFQTYLRELKSRGVLLAVCSKNDEATARAAFVQHPEMVLRLDDFAAFKANWDPKSDNIAAIARELDLGLDAFVFVDDNPAEREQVRQALPMVAVPELGDDPADFPGRIEAGRYFEIVALTAEDRARTEAYRQRHAAVQAAASATDLTSYLKSLEIRAVIRPFEPLAMDRVTQLTNKTNQFNLTTRRVTRSEMERLAADPGVLTRYVRLADRFGDHGIISVLFGTVSGATLTIDAWLMSCRVLKRGVEQALFNDVLAAARQRGLREIIGIHRPSERNGMVRDHYRDLGFEALGEGDGESRWRLALDEAAPLEAHICVEESIQAARAAV